MIASQEINIAALLKDCPEGTKLYSSLCGECYLYQITEDKVCITDLDGRHFDFSGYGKIEPSGECLLFPSKEVRDWYYFGCRYMTGGDNTLHILTENGGMNVLCCDCTDRNKAFFIDHDRTIRETEIGSFVWQNLEAIGARIELRTLVRVQLGKIMYIPVEAYDENGKPLIEECDVRWAIRNQIPQEWELEKLEWSTGNE